MRVITSVLAKTIAVLGRSSAALLCSVIVLNTVMINTVAAADIEGTYHNSCAACHDSGALNAIKKGDSQAWQQLIQQKTMPKLINSVKGGMIQMPAGGLCEICSDEDYRQLIEYMIK